MEIEQYLWGASAEGEDILLYTLRCAGGREVRLSNAGAAVTGIFAAGADGRPEALTPVFETPEALLADYADRGKTLCANRYGFGQRIWQSRVETDRIVMELPAGDDGLPALAVLFDLDDDGQFAVTHLARGATAAPFTMTTQLFWQGDWRPTLRTQEGPATDDEGRFRPIEGWRRNILGEAARLDDPAAGRTIEILTSQPEIRIVRHDGQLALLCGDSRPAPLDDETLYCQKDVYRF